MSAPADLQGLPWPEGDPDALGSSAQRLAGLGGTLEGFATRVGAMSQPGGWVGRGADSFTAASGEQARMLRARGADLRAAGGALNTLSIILESSQGRVERAALKLGEAKQEAREANQAAKRAAARAREARSAADNPLIVAPLGGFNPLELAAQAAESDSADAARLATRANEKLERVERWAKREVEDANADVRRADRATADQISDLGESFGVPMGKPIPTAVSTGGGTVPISALAALAKFLGTTSRSSPSSRGGLGGGLFADDASPLPVAKGKGTPDELRQLALLSLAGEGLRSGIASRGKGIGYLPGIPAVGPPGAFERGRIERNVRKGVPGRYKVPGRYINPRDLPAGTRAAFTNPFVRTAARYGVPGVSLAGGGILDYMNARAEGDSVGRAAREAGVVGVTTTAGTYAGGVVCGAIGTGTAGAGYVSCVVLVPTFAAGGKFLGDGINWAIDGVGL